jgi:hypothetical protein
MGRIESRSGRVGVADEILYTNWQDLESEVSESFDSRIYSTLHSFELSTSSSFRHFAFLVPDFCFVSCIHVLRRLFSSMMIRSRRLVQFLVPFVPSGFSNVRG